MSDQHLQALKELPEKIRKVLEVDAKVLKVAQVNNHHHCHHHHHGPCLLQRSSGTGWLIFIIVRFIVIAFFIIVIFKFILIPFIKMMTVDDQELYEKRSLLIMGRGYNYATCLEGALKAKYDDNDHDDENVDYLK